MLRLVDVEMLIFCTVARKSSSFKVYFLSIHFGQGLKHQGSSVSKVPFLFQRNKSYNYFPNLVSEEILRDPVSVFNLLELSRLNYFS